MIQEEDIRRVATDLGIDVSDERIKEILKDYPERAESMPTENWSFIVEDMLYE